MKQLTKILPEEIGFDFDGVIADIGEAFLRLACERYNYCSYTLEDLTRFQVEECVAIPPETIHTIFDDILNDSLATGLQPMEGMVDVLTELAVMAPVTIVTARILAQPVEDWLTHFLPRATCQNIALIAMGDHDDKVRHLQELKLKYFIDDRLETCKQIADAKLIPYLFSHPWNQQGHDFRAVRNWQDIRSMIATPR